MTTREALIAGIAANPADDLPRLVAADWFEENGDPERAEFIRLHVAEAERPDQEGQARLRQLFLGRATDWFAPCLLALDPACHPATDFDRRWAERWGYLNRSDRAGRRPFDGPPPSFLESASVARGFLDCVEVYAANRPAGLSIADGFRVEPIAQLRVVVTSEPRCWERFTHPALRQLRSLTLIERTDGRRLTAITPAFHDPDLVRVTDVMIGILSSNGSFGMYPPPTDTLTEFGESPLAARTRQFMVCAGDDELPTLARLSLPALTDLSVHGVITAAGVRAIAEAAFAPRLRALRIDTFHYNLPGVFAPLADGSALTRLTDLDLGRCPVDDASLAAFAAGPLVRRLERLDLSGCNGLTPAGVRAVAVGLDPARLAELRLPAEGPSSEWLRERFGERVVFG